MSAFFYVKSRLQSFTDGKYSTLFLSNHTIDRFKGVYLARRLVISVLALIYM